MFVFTKGTNCYFTVQVQVDTQESPRVGESGGEMIYVCLYVCLYIILKSQRKDRQSESKGLGLSLQLLAVFYDSKSFCVLAGNLDDVLISLLQLCYL